MNSKTLHGQSRKPPDTKAEKKGHAFKFWRLRSWVGLHVKRIYARGKVSGGAFSGMSYINQSVGSQLNPKWLGTYECELISLFEGLQQTAFQTIIDVGAAEGYYAVGVARKWPEAHVTAFESTLEGREAIKEMARLNGVSDRITIRGHCEATDLAGILLNDNETLIVMDVEGAEYELLDPSRVPGLLRSHIIVELHEWVHPDVASVLQNRFAPTHAVFETWTRDRTISDFEEPRSSLLRFLFKRSLIAAVDEWRGGPMRWLYFQPKRQA